jgi:hypothetical protein
MSAREPDKPDEPVPPMQKVFDNVYLLLVAGIIIMFVIYTGWGLWEVLTMPRSTLP